MYDVKRTVRLTPSSVWYKYVAAPPAATARAATPIPVVLRVDFAIRFAAPGFAVEAYRRSVGAANRRLAPVCGSLRNIDVWKVDKNNQESSFGSAFFIHQLPRGELLSCRGTSKRVHPTCRHQTWSHFLDQESISWCEFVKHPFVPFAIRLVRF